MALTGSSLSVGSDGIIFPQPDKDITVNTPAIVLADLRMYSSCWVVANATMRNVVPIIYINTYIRCDIVIYTGNNVAIFPDFGVLGW